MSRVLKLAGLILGLSLGALHAQAAPVVSAAKYSCDQLQGLVEDYSSLGLRLSDGSVHEFFSQAYPGQCPIGHPSNRWYRVAVRSLDSNRCVVGWSCNPKRFAKEQRPSRPSYPHKKDNRRPICNRYPTECMGGTDN